MIDPQTIPGGTSLQAILDDGQEARAELRQSVDSMLSYVYVELRMPGDDCWAVLEHPFSKPRLAFGWAAALTKDTDSFRLLQRKYPGPGYEPLGPIRTTAELEGPGR